VVTYWTRQALSSRSSSKSGWHRASGTSGY